MATHKYKDAGCAYFWAICIMIFTAMHTPTVAASDTPPDYHYTGQMAINPQTGFIDLTWKIQVVNPEISDISFALRKTLSNIAVTGANVTSSKIEALDGGDLQKITLTLSKSPDTIKTGSEKTGSEKTGIREFTLTYNGVLLPVPMDNLINHIGSDYVELNVDSFWHPIDMRFDRYLTSTVTVTIDATWDAVTGGTTSKTDKGIQLVNSIPALDISFALSPNFRKTTLPGIEIYDLRKTETDTNTVATAAQNCYAYLQPMFGQKTPLPDGRFVLHDRPESGYARYNYIALSDVSGRDQASITGFLCHELTHFWSRHGNFNTVENWLNESFAVYAELMAVRHFHSDETFLKRIEKLQDRVSKADIPTIYDGEDLSRRPYLVNYGSGPLALYSLEEKIGREKFKTFITAYMEGAVATTPDLIALLGDITDSATAVWFKDLLAGR